MCLCLEVYRYGKRGLFSGTCRTGRSTVCFFITDPSKTSRVVVRRGKRKIIGMDGVANEQDFDKYGDPRIEHDDDDEVAAYTTRRSRTTLPKGRPFHRRTPFAKKKGKKIVNR